MIRKYNILVLSIFLSLWASALRAQEPKTTWVLNKDESSDTKKYVARESIILQSNGTTSGFKFTADPANPDKTFSAKIDQTLVFPPTDKTYATPNGTITTDPTQGGIVGSIPGQFGVSASGGASYTIPIECPQGINGMQPSISLVYNSQGGRSIAGWGWNISGLSSITRTKMMKYYDGRDSCVIWDKKCPLTLDGQRLIKISETVDSVEYRTENESYSRIVGYSIQSWGPTYFKVFTKSGLTMTYGDSNNPASYAPLYSDAHTDGLNGTNSVNAGWNLVKVIDNNGNYMNIEYSSTENSYVGNLVKRILYGANQKKNTTPNLIVTFNYEKRPDDIQAYVSGKELLQQFRLKTIQLSVNSSVQKTYTLNYTGESISRLGSFEVALGTNRVFNPLTFVYGETNKHETNTDISFIKKYTDNTDKTKIGLAIFDLDGDGKNEIGDLYTKVNTLSASCFMDFHYKKDNWAINDGCPLSISLFSSKIAVEGLPSQFGDFNGKGTTQSLFSYLASGNGALEIWDRKNGIKIFNCSIGYTTNQPFISTGNFYGYPLSNAIVVINDPEMVDRMYRYKYFIIAGNNNSTPSKFPSPTDNYYYLYSPKKISSITIANFSGNTLKDDIWMDFTDGTKGILKNNQSSTNCFSGLSQFQVSLPFTINNDEIYRLVDLNQDGFLDVVYRKNPITWKVAYNKGDYTFQIKDLAIDCSSTNDGSDNINFVDINNDGLIDIVAGDEISSNQTLWKFYINSGNGFALVRTYSSPEKSNYACFGDVLGYGETNWVHTDSVGKVVITDFGYGLNKNTLVKVTDGLHGEQDIKYKTLADFTEYDALTDNEDHINTSADYINIGFQPFKTTGILLTSKFNNGLSQTTYHYGTALNNCYLRGFVGFRYLGVDNETTGISSLKTNKPFQSNYLLLPKHVDVSMMLANHPVSRDSYEYSIISLGGNRFSTQLDNHSLTDYLKDNTISDTFDYDTAGNLTNSLKDFGSEIQEETQFSYIKSGAWCLNKVDTTKIIKRIWNVDSQNEEFTKKTVYSYDIKGNLLKEIVDPLDTNSVVTEYKNFNYFGQPDTIAVSANGTTRKSSMTYSSSGRFVLSKTDPLNVTVSYDWDETKGLLNSETGVFGKATYTYDYLNRLTETRSPDGIRSTSVLQWASPNNAIGAKYYKYSEESGQAPVYVWYDAFGREIQKDTYGLSNKKISVSTEYNSRGMTYRVSDPYFAADAKKWTTVYAYDAYNRVDSVTTLAGTTTYSYDNLKTTVKSPEGTTSNEQNVLGQTVVSTVNDKAVEYVYFASGQLRESYPFGNYSEDTQPIQVEYDHQGNRTKISDPDAGIITSKYNGFGELLWEKQDVHKSKEPVTKTYNYMANGLLRSEVSKKEAITGTVTDSTVYSYDPNNHYRLTDIELKGKNKQTATYGDFDRVTQLLENVQGKSFTFRVDYDNLGRVMDYYYPTGYYTVNHFDSNGNMIEVTDNNKHSIWKALEENALGQLKRISKGGKETTFGYDSRNMLSSIFSDSIQNMTFSTKANGNLDYRIDNRTGQREDFKFDPQNRLTNWNISRGGNIWNNSMTYDGNGNISTKSDLGLDALGQAFKMNYGEKKADGTNCGPHALTTIMGKPVAIPIDSLTVTYTDFKKIATLSEGAKSYTLSYGVDDQRRLSVYKVGGVTQLTHYYLGDYEEEVDAAGNVRKIHYLSGAILIQNKGVDSLLYTYTDNQGSLIALTNESGKLIERYAYDPWGQRRNPDQWELKDSRTHWIVNRGYTGHEHLDAFGIINMNGRVYDPLTAMFFSPDPILNGRDWLSYNRYGYCLENPFKYTDPSGKNPLLIGAAIYFLFFTETGYDVQKYILPVAIHINVGIGSDQKFLGYEFSVGIPKMFPVSYRYNYGQTYNWNSFDNSFNGKVSVEGSEWSFLGLFSYGGLKYTSTSSNGESTSQTTNIATLGIPGLNIKYEDDHNALRGYFSWLPGIPKGSGDKYRTSAGKLNIALFSVGYNLMTGEEAPGEHNIDGVNYHNETNVHRLGLVYFGLGPLKFGYNSEKVRDLFQNKWIHQRHGLDSLDVLNDPNGKYYYPDRSYWSYGSTGGSSLW